ncbi:MAG: sigma-70 family RNA polymerase sigma factor [Solirubrobacterales bacterium]
MSHLVCRRAELQGLLEDAQSEPEDDSPAMNEIVRRFEGLAQKIARSLTADEFLQEDLADEALIALVKAVRRHDSSRPTFPAFAQVYMRGAAIRELGHWSRTGSERADRAPLEIPLEATDLVDHLPPAGQPEEEALVQLAPWGAGQVAEVIEGLDEPRVRLLKLRYVEDAPLAAIADEAEVSVSAISQRLDTVHRRIEAALAA